MDFYKAEYIWVDGTEPTAKLRSKTKIVPVGEEPPIWGFDGSSTNQATGEQSDCVLQPVHSIDDPLRDDGDKLVMCEVLLPDMSPHPTNTRRACAETGERFAGLEAIFGIEQEYTLFKGARPLGFPEGGYPLPQGGYYCSVGASEIFGREVVEEHLSVCLDAGLLISGINGEVMPGQWEFQVGPLATPRIADELWLARWLLHRVAEEHKDASEVGVTVSLDAKPAKGDWNGAGAHTNFSTKAMRESYPPIIAAIEALKGNHEHHIANYGAGIEERLTGLHETASYKEFKYGVSDRGASIRIPWQVERDQCGYIEDRRPNANMDPYVVTRLILDTVGSAVA